MTQLVVNIFDINGNSTSESLETPQIFGAELRADIVHTVHEGICLNARQAVGVSPYAGKQHSAESLGTGRALARVPRVKGSGTSRCGQAAFANFARKGHMAHPKSVQRRLKVDILAKLKSKAYVSAIASTGHADIVEGRGHRISEVKMLPIVVTDEIDNITKTKDAVSLLNSLGCGEDMERVRKSKTITCGKGKMRNRRYNKRKGPLIVHDGNELKAFANISEIDTMDINNLDIVKLAPGGKMGRLVVWTKSAFKKLDEIFGENSKYDIFKKTVSIGDLDEYFYSNEIQSIIVESNMLEKGSCLATEADIATKKEYIELYKA